MSPGDKDQIYRRTLGELAAVLDGLADPIAAMASAASLLHQALPAASWTGFYRVVEPGLLRVGPYQGPLGCLEIPFGRGVCGATALERRSQVVADVEAFPGHIACDALARSEITVPIFDPGGELVAVLDIDSHQPAAFDELDRQHLETAAALLAHAFAPPASTVSTESAPG